MSGWRGIRIIIQLLKNNKDVNTQHHRWQKGELTKDQLGAWSAKGREQHDLCKKGKISFKTFYGLSDTDFATKIYEL